jgi:hypothetical protein
LVDPVKPIPITTPSFEIRGATGQPQSPLRFDRIDSGRLITLARRIYLLHFEQGPASVDPLGVVLHPQTGQGRVVFEIPVLLPNELFVPLELLRGRVSRQRPPRSPLRS